MIGRKGPLLLEIIDLELEGADPTFSSYFNSPELWGTYSDVGRNPADDDEVKVGGSRSADSPTWLNWAQISSNYLYLSKSGKPQLQKNMRQRAARFVSYFGVGIQIR